MALKIGQSKCKTFYIKFINLVAFSNPLQPLMINQNSRFQSQKTDLLLINEISRPSLISQLQAPTNINQLHNLLKFKNTKSTQSRQEKQNAQTWLNQQGIDISPLVQRVRKVKEITFQKQELKKIEEDCLFYIPDMSYKKIEEYEAKANDYATLALIQHNMKKDRFTKKIINKVNAKYSQNHRPAQTSSNEQAPMRMFTTISTQPRDEEKRDKYIKCISMWAKDSMRSEDLAIHLSQKINNKFWTIMANHIKCVNQASDLSENKRMAELYMESLRMVEDEYKTGLTEHTNDKLNYCLSRDYLEKLERFESEPNLYIRDRQNGAFWGRAFLLYRSGRRREFYSMLAERSETLLLQAFREVDQSIDRRQPITKDIPSTAGDVFKEQLIFAVRGESKIAHPVLAERDSMDIIWLILRSMGIFYDSKRAQLARIKQQVLGYYAGKPMLTKEQLYNYFYLLAYDDIVVLGLSDIMDQDDFVHFLVCLNRTPGLVKGSQQECKGLLKSQLLMYIQELISLGKAEYVHYMLLIPQEFRVAEISTILSSSNLVSTFDWQYLRANIPSKAEFELIVKKTLEKQFLTTTDCLSVADKYYELLNDGQESAKCLLKFLIKKFMANSQDDEGAYRVQTAADKYIYLTPDISLHYKSVLNFLVECRKLLSLVKDRKDDDIYRLVSDSQYVMLGSVVPQKHMNLLGVIVQLSQMGLDVYFKYMKKILAGLNIYFTRKNDNAQFVDFVNKIAENASFTLGQEPYQAYKNRTEVKEFYQVVNSYVSRR